MDVCSYRTAKQRVRAAVGIYLFGVIGWALFLASVYIAPPAHWGAMIAGWFQ